MAGAKPPGVLVIPVDQNLMKGRNLTVPPIARLQEDDNLFHI